MQYQSLHVEELNGKLIITLCNEIKRNAINNNLLIDFHKVLDHAEQNNNINLIIIQATGDYFCIGLDFDELVKVMGNDNEILVKNGVKLYMQVLKRFSMINKVIITKLDGLVMAGGIGFISASDYVIASPRAKFSLSEALWGLLPCNVLPYLIRRVGFQPAYRMCLTASTIDAEQALRYHLIDEISVNLDESLYLLCLKLNRLKVQTIYDLKQFFKKMWIINETMEDYAINETTRLALTPHVINNIKNYVNNGVLPWENTCTT